MAVREVEVYYVYLFLLRFVNILIGLGFIWVKFSYQLLWFICKILSTISVQGSISLCIKNVSKAVEIKDMHE